MAKSLVEIQAKLNQDAAQSKRSYTINQRNFFGAINDMLYTLMGYKDAFTSPFSVQFD